MQGLDISWSFHGSSKVPGKMKTNKITPRSSLLMIAHASVLHSGVYTCSAQNWAGKVTYSTNILINGTF